MPVKTGFSYATTEKANQTDNLQTGEHAYQFLQKVISFISLLFLSALEFGVLVVLLLLYQWDEWQFGF